MTRSLTRATLILALGIAASACGVRTTTTDVNPNVTRKPTCDEAVVVYKDRNEVPADYYELAFISAEGNSVYTSDNQINTQIKKKAAEAGANAIIANPIQESKATVKVLGEALGAKSAQSQATALAIWMPAQADRVAAQCGTR
ncbi:MAG TPA: hypothetical protein VM939_08380 [Gemmatimonadaceae bacterium]|nr:hypothetical protein [Gemmatimonadaceae bacterium]